MEKRKGFETVTDDITDAFRYLEHFGFKKEIIKDEGWISVIVYNSEMFRIELRFEYIAGHFSFFIFNKIEKVGKMIWKYLEQYLPDFNYENYKPDEFGYYKIPLKNIAEDFKKIIKSENIFSK